LPDGLFSNQKSQLGQSLKGLAMERVGIFYCHLVYSVAIWQNFTVLWYSFMVLWYISPGLVSFSKKNLSTLVLRPILESISSSELAKFKVWNRFNRRPLSPVCKTKDVPWTC
jgi:hypothetical protein